MQQRINASMNLNDFMTGALLYQYGLCRLLLIFVILLTFSSVSHAGSCQEPKLEHVSDMHPECLFYKGTRLYREKDYRAASVMWQKLINETNLSKEFEHVQIDAYNNLGFLYYMGWGVRQDRKRAIEEYWLPAEKRGHEESAYHLCHAYAKSEPKAALGYCREALRRYERLDKQDEATAEVVSQIKEFIARLESK